MAELVELNSRLKAKRLDKFYIFAGSEWKVQEIYMNQIAKVAKKSIQRIESIADIMRKRKGSSFIKESHVYVVRDDKDLMADFEKLNLDNIIKDDILILLVSTVDKRKKFFKTYNDCLFEFNPLEPSNLKKYLKKEIDLSDKNMNKLIEVCEGNYGRCLLEIDKIKHHAKATKAEDMLNNVFELLLFDGTIHVPAKDAIFDFVDAILDNKYEQIFDLYNQCLAVGEATMVMLSVLYTNARAVLQVQTCESKDVSKSTGLTGWQIMNAKKHLHKWKNDELMHMLEIIQKCESGIKAGKIADDAAMEYVLVNVL